MSKVTCGAKQLQVEAQLDQLKFEINNRVESVFSSRPTWSAAGWDLATLQGIEQVVDQEVNKLKKILKNENYNQTNI